MFLKKFLWFLSLSVFAAGLVYYFYLSERPGPPKRGDGAGITGSGRLLLRVPRPNLRLLSGSVGENSTFWYLTPADRTITNDLVVGSSLVSWTDPGRQWALFRFEPSPLAGTTSAPDDGSGPGELDATDPGTAPFKARRPD